MLWTIQVLLALLFAFSGLMKLITPDYGDVVLAEYTQPFNEGDVTYFGPLYQQAAVALEQFPTHLAADAAFDTWYVYQKAALHGGEALVPLNAHSLRDGRRDPDGVPVCSIGHRMHKSYFYAHPNGYRARIFRCPLLHPEPIGAFCDHPQFLKGKGCVKHPNWEAGGLQRVLLDRC